MINEIKVKIEIDGQTLEFIGEKMELDQEAGLRKILNDDGSTDKIEHNGHFRYCLKLWSGCDKWDDFVKEE